MKNTDFTLVRLGRKRSNEAERHINREERAKEERGEKSHSVSFEPVSPCWVEFDIQTMRQGSTQGGRPPCNINSHLESSCGYEHETLKETAAMDPVPSHHLSHCLLKRPPHCSPKPAWKSTQTGSSSSCNFPFDWALWPTRPSLCVPWMSWEMSPTSGWGKVLSRPRLCVRWIKPRKRDRTWYWWSRWAAKGFGQWRVL